jgi:hypothetical protein
MKKGRQKGNKSHELFWAAWYSEPFQNDLLRIRKRFDIPPEGFTGDSPDLSSEEKRWLHNLTPEDKRCFAAAIIQMAKKHQLPTTMLRIIELRLLDPSHPFLDHVGFTPMCGLEQDDPVLIAGSRTDDQVWRQSGLPFVTMYISDYANLAEAQKFLKDAWPRVQKLLRQKRGDQPKRRIRMTKTQKLRQFLIEEHAKLKCHGRTKGGLDMLLSRSATAKFGKPITPENIRALLSRERKRRGM